MESSVTRTVPERAASIFAFLKDLLKMRNRPAPTLSELSRKAGHWVHILDSTTTLNHGVKFWSSSGMIDSSSLQDGGSSSIGTLDSERFESRHLLLRVPKVVEVSPPEPSFALGPWVDGDIQNPNSEITIFLNSRSLSGETDDVLISDEDDVQPDSATPSEYGEIEAEFSKWLMKWQAWSTATKRSAEVRKLYQSLYETRIQIRDQDQDWEFVLGIGRLKHSTISANLDRHLFTVQCDIDLDEITGTLTVRIDDNKVFGAEDDWIVGVSKPEISELKKTLEELNEDDGFTSERLKEILNRFANKYLPGLTTDSSSSNSNEDNSLKLSPALLLRKRTSQDLIKVLEQLEKVTEETLMVSAPMNSILDFESRDKSQSSDWSTDGAAIFLDDEIYLPLSLNENQKRALKLSESKITTLIQGPPGTGKTRTIATMLTHFLSKGERVLVTAATSQALKEVRSQIPLEIRDLVVSNLGKGKSSGDDLQKAVNSLQAANENRAELSEGFSEYENSALAEIARLHRERAGTFRQIIDIRSLEVGEIELEGVSGTPAHHAYSYLAQGERLRWFEEISDSKVRGVPFTSTDAESLKSSLRSIWSETIRIGHEPKLPAKEQLWTSEKLLRGFRIQASIENFTGDAVVAPDIAIEILQTLEFAIENCSKYTSASLPWFTSVTENFLLGHPNSAEFERLKNADQSAEKALGFLELAGGLNEIACGRTSLDWLPVLENLKVFISQRGELELNNLGELKAGIFRNSIVKRAKEILSEVKVLGRFPNNGDSIDRIVALVKADSEMKNLATILKLSEEGLPNVRTSSIYWAGELRSDIALILNTSQKMRNLKSRREKYLTDVGFPLGTSEEISHTIEACRIVASRAEAKEFESEIKSHVLQLSARFKGQLPNYFVQYSQAIDERDLSKFENAIDDVTRHIEAQNRVIAVREMVQQMFHPDSRLIETAWNWINESPTETEEIEICILIENMVDAFRWKRVRDGLSEQVSGNYEYLFATLKNLENKIELQVRDLSRRRAWKKALERIGGETLEYMSRFAIESKKLGAGTGMNAPRRRREIRSYLEKCTDAIPAWIMPISRIAESFNPQLEMFDVVIVDEASQAGIDALFLLALGKRVVVVGDHKQVSPDSMYMKVDELREIVTRHLAGDARVANWSNTDFSLFDECKSVFGAPLTLTEHRRCVPAIIGFSNEIAYIPDGIRLIPVRQTGAQSLSPIKTVFVADGYVRGTTSITNPPEAEKIVELIEQMINDVAYKGLSIGVITLQGTEQQNKIRNLLIDRIDTQEIERREIRVGNPSSFQGSERDVILLSMVMAPNKKFVAQTTEKMVQRYNVAMSRAKDQVVLVHSLRLTDLKNELDLRWKLLNYCLMIEEGRGERYTTSRNLVSEDTPVAPFDSLFEQRVHNRIVERGYAVISQYEPNIDGHSYRIDLVVVGPYGMLAIECDGDFWHGPEEYERDLRRMQILETCNWKFFRIRESEFYNNPESLAELWPMLDALDISVEKFPMNETQIVDDGDNEKDLEFPIENVAESDLDDSLDGIPETARDQEFVMEDDLVSVVVPAGSETHLIDNFKPLLSEELENGLRVREFSKQLAPEFIWLQPYRSWDREDVSSFTHVARRSKQTRTELREIVRVEGPILGSYLIRRHYKATGGSSLSSNNESLYIRQLEDAVIRGELLAEDRTAGNSLATATFRLPEQLPVEMRIRGLRDLYDMPPREIAQIIRNVLRTKPNLDLESNRELVFRQVLELLDFTKLTKKSEEFLDKILAEYQGEIRS